MKIKNIASGDFVQIKKSLCHSEFKAKQVCEVIDTDHTDKHGFDVLIQGKNCLDWVNHKDLKKPIKRDTAKELLEVDLGSELTGSDLARAMFERGDKIVLCIVRDYEHEDYTYYDAITHCSDDYFDSSLSSWRYAVPINNQGEPLTASEVGL